MHKLLHLKADEINNSLVDFIKSSFKGKKITVHIYEDEMNESESLTNESVSENPFSEKEIKLLKLFANKKSILEIFRETNFSPLTITKMIDKLKTNTRSNSIEELIERAVEKGVIE
jgi:DNA-binding NarL/FixJ family response regulator